MALRAGATLEDDARRPDFPVLGPENSLLRHCLQTLLPGREIAYNPVVLVGRSGSGKSHCLDYLEGSWRHGSAEKQAPSAVVRWEGKDLEKEILSALDSDGLHRIHQRFVAAKLVLVDGLDRVEKPAVLQVFSALIDRAIEADGQVVVTLGHFPVELKDFPASLASRLSDGLLVTVRLPEQESRRSLVATIAERCGLVIDDAVLTRLSASEIPSEEIRERLEALASQGCGRVGTHEAASLFSNAAERHQTPSIRRIISTTARHYGLESAELLGPSRHKNIANARSAAIFLARRLTGRSLVDIGKTFGGRDHTTVLHSIRVTRKRSESDPAWQRDLDAILARLA